MTHRWDLCQRCDGIIARFAYTRADKLAKPCAASSRLACIWIIRVRRTTVWPRKLANPPERFAVLIYLHSPSEINFQQLLIIRILQQRRNAWKLIDKLFTHMYTCVYLIRKKVLSLVKLQFFYCVTKITFELFCA